MGKPAARMGDQVMNCNDPADLPVGTIISTTATVMINNMPAAKQGDKVVGVDTHIIMIPTPGGPVPTPLPHPFNGTLLQSLSTTVQIEGKFAAMQDSIAINNPPHIPQGGPFQKPPSNQGKVMLGSFNVMIGNGGGGGGGSSRGGGGGGAAAVESAPQEVDPHRLDVKFVDKGGFPVSGVEYSVEKGGTVVSSGVLAGQIAVANIEEGSYDIKLRAITKAVWSKAEARDGETVKAQMEGVGFADGAKATFEIWQRDINRADRMVETFEDVDISGDKAEAEWSYQWDEESPSEVETERAPTPQYSEPSFYFIVKVGGLQSRSPILGYKDFIEITLEDENGDPAADAAFRVVLPHGGVQEGNLDGNGYRKIENVPPGAYRVEFPEFGIAQEEEDEEEVQG